MNEKFVKLFFKKNIYRHINLVNLFEINLFSFIIIIIILIIITLLIIIITLLIIIMLKEINVLKTSSRNGRI